jgi:hypothetical protein
MKRWTKGPDETLRYRFDWSLVLAEGETIATSAWTIPAGLTDTSPASDDTTADITLAGGLENRSYVLANRITTSAGAVMERHARLDVVPMR